MQNFEVSVEREGRKWRIHAPELANLDAFTRRIADIEVIARHEIAPLLGTDVDDIAIRIATIMIPELGEVLAEAREVVLLRQKAADLTKRSNKRTDEFIKRLVAADVPVRDIATLLGEMSPQRVSQISNAPTTGGIDMELWPLRTRWAKSISLSDETFVEITGIPLQQAQAAAQADRASTAPGEEPSGFPQPIPPRAGGSQRWPTVDTFMYTLTMLPTRAAAVPALFPSTAEPTPAVFVDAIRVNLEDRGDFAVHVWQPGDGGARVAMAYADNFVEPGPPAKDVAAILSRLDESIAAVALANNEITALRTSIPGQDPVDDGYQPCLVVADRHTKYLPDPAGVDGVSRYWWTELANLLRTDIPWWPRHLRELGAMLSWRPSSQIQTIVPAARDQDPRAVTGVATITDPPLLRSALEHQAALILHRLAVFAAEETYDITPGLFVAAMSAVDHRGPEPKLSLAEQSAILHHRTTFERYRAMSIAIVRWDWMPLVTHGMKLHLESAGPIAQCWISRLIDVTADRYDEIGFWRLHGYLSASRTPVRWMTDPMAPNSWILQDDSGYLYATVGTRTLNAVGVLTAAETDNEAMFFTDSDGTAWPIPDHGFDYYKTGYGGGGTQRLTETIITLLNDASADVHRPTDFYPDCALFKMLSEVADPIAIPQEMLEELKSRSIAMRGA
ncbi:hypothetical protein [Mycobacteroides salmoniphilum]|uniref:Uncharacterized protein n=1 Tax=Mycobacteroides salmoniphilum TaxID=404941 RepID=A0A4R8SZR5_9MYCO|nr:hypothetical protein [Mycobacteroides salmoniphilum]TEA09079.1 hypothetical protein CCUG60884_00247 [Mycobacteroides salmoniphilum]